MNRIFLSCLILIITSGKAFCQKESSNADAKVVSSIADYFKLDRENIHLQLNKGIYLSDEDVWFKGYIIEKKNSLPYVTTVNVYVQILNSKGEVVASHLIYAENSTFQGSLKSNANLTSGKYYLRAFTNYMNNFIEDESSIIPFSIINRTDPFIDTKKFDHSSAEISFYPEGGVFLDGITNTIGVKIEDCNGNGIVVANGEIVNSKGVVINNFSTDQHGYGKFDIVSTQHERYTASYTLDSKKITADLPLPSLSGVVLSVNNYALANKTVIKVKTNSRASSFSDGHFKLLISKSGQSSVVDISMDGKSELTVAIPNESLFEGINIMNITDKNFTNHSERIIYNPFTINNQTDLTVLRKTKDSIYISGKSALKLGDISASILPANTISGATTNSIYGSLIFNNYFSSGSDDYSYYLSGFNRKKHYELDNLLLTKTSKYNLETMLKNAPSEKYEFDNGLNIKGTVNTTISDKANYRVTMKSFLLGVDASSTLNEKNEFFFKNVFVVDSTTLHFSLLNKKSTVEQIKMHSQIVNNNRTFKHALIIAKKCEIVNSPITKNGNSDEFIMPKIRDMIVLDTVSIAGKKKKTEAEKNSRRINGMADGFKISENEVAMYPDVLSFIQAHGFQVSYEGANVYIKSRIVNTFKGSLTPLIYFDDVPFTDFNSLQYVGMETIDEISINRSGFGGGSGASNGIIRIYSKIENGGISNVVVKSFPMVVLNGFQNATNYQNPQYDNYTDLGFKNYGSIHWIPKILTDANGEFHFAIPNFGQNSLKVMIDGISGDGQMISSVAEVQVP